MKTEHRACGVIVDIVFGDVLSKTNGGHCPRALRAPASADATRKACGDGGGSYCSLHRLLVGRLLRGELYTSPVR
jgi:hypothetical protein